MKRTLLLLLLAGVCLPTFAQWNIMQTGLPDSLLVFRIASSSPDVVWGTTVDWGADFSVEAQPHIVRTKDGGSTWSVSQFADTYSEFATSIAALDANTALVATFDFASGEGSLYRTADGGATWSELNEADNGIALADPFGFPNKIHFWDERNGILLGDPDASGHFEIYTTRNGGRNWVRSQDPDLLAAADGSEYGNFEGFGTAGVNTAFFATSYPHHRILKSDDRGLTWRQVHNPLEGDTLNPSTLSSIVFEDERRGQAFVQFNPNNPGFGQQVPMLRTDDGGENWYFVSAANYDEYQERGIAVKVPGADCQYVIGHYNQAVSYTDDCGDSYSYDPTIAGVGLQMHSPDDGWLSLFYLGGTGGEVARFTGNLSPGSTRNVTLQVDMSGIAVSPAGVHVASSLNGWSTTATPMTPVGNGIYEATVQVSAGTGFNYKFINGDSWGQNESVPAGCGVENNPDSYDRTYVAGEWDVRLEAVCFGSCISCGETAPSPDFYCQPGSLLCEIFDGRPAGPLFSSGVGGGAWFGSGGFVTGYYHGFTNNSGARSLLLRNEAARAAYGLGNRQDGTFEVSMKLYVPANHEARFSLLNEQDVPASSVFDYVLETNRTAWKNDGTYVTYPQNRWFDVKMTADMDARSLAVWVDGQQVWQTSSQQFVQLGGLAFYGSEYGGFLVDDIALHELGSDNAKPLPGFAKSFSAGKSYPNPAADVLFVPYEFESAGDLSLRLTDAAGRLVFSTEVAEAEAGVESVQLDGLAPGVYFLKLKHPAAERVERVVIR